jgi:hypothetical protein
MKLRTTGNSIRLRLSQTDVRNFAEEGFVEETLQINRALGQRFVYKLKRDEAAKQMAVSFENNCLSVYMPASLADGWITTEQIGAEIEGTSDQPAIVVEKDFACLKPRAGAEDVDTFPNPEAKSVC